MSGDRTIALQAGRQSETPSPKKKKEKKRKKKTLCVYIRAHRKSILIDGSGFKYFSEFSLEYLSREPLQSSLGSKGASRTGSYEFKLVHSDRSQAVEDTCQSIFRGNIP